MKNLEFTEITQPVKLCNVDNSLNPEARGWSRWPIITGNVKGHSFRKKKWNYWCITSPRYLFSATISDVDYVGLIFVYYMDFETGEYAEDTLMLPLGWGIKMGEEVSNAAEYTGKNVQVKFTYKDNAVQLSTRWNNFHGKVLESELLVTIPANHETLNVVVPWSAKRFQYTSKQHGLPVQGYFKIGNTKSMFSQQDAFACLDFGRGVWPYAISWNWGAFSAKVNEQTVGFNAGGKWTDSTGISENSVVVNGKLFKIQEPVEWQYNNSNFMQPWKIKSTLTNTVDLTFTPFFDRTAKSNLLLLQSEVHQCFGKYSGHITTGGLNLNIDNVIGWAEEHKARW